MTIEILSITTNTESLTGESFRHVEIIITSGGNSYLWDVGGLPVEGDLQTILEAREAEDLAAAIAAGVEANVPKIEIERTPGAARQWFVDNPQARLIWSMSVTDLAAEIASLVDVSFPSLSVGNRLRWKLLVTGIVLAVRVLVKRESLD